MAREPMAIVEVYSGFLSYAYPKVQNCPRRHGVLRDQVLTALLQPVGDFHLAGRSNQISRLYQLDAQIDTLRFWLRFLADPARKVLTPSQAAEAMRRLDEAGRMLGAWINGHAARVAGKATDSGAATRARG